MPLPQGFGNLKKSTAKLATPADVKPQELAQAPKPAVLASPAKSRAQILREEAAAAEAEEAAQSAKDAEAADLAKEAEVVAATEPTKPVKTLAVPSFAGLSTLTRSNAASALAAFAEVADERRAIHLYPVLQVHGGDAGGLFTVPKGQPEEINAKLPEGRKPLRMVFLGYRFDVTIWPAAKGDSDKGGRPLAQGVINCADVATIALMTRATKAHQYTPKPQKKKFDVDAAGEGSGHPRPTMEILVYSPDLGGLLIVRCQPGFGPTKATLDSLARLIDPATGELPQFPGTMRIDAKDIESKESAWKDYSFAFDVDIKESGRALVKEFSAFAEANKDDAAAVEKANQWLSGADHPITDAVRDRLKLVLAL